MTDLTMPCGDGAASREHPSHPVPHPVPMPVWMPWLEAPALSAGVLDCVRRLPVRQRVEEVPGRWLWLPRLGVSVLAHEHTEAGWLCTLITVDSRADSPPVRLPAGVLVVAEVEVATAFSTRWPWDASAGLSQTEFCDAWRVRAAVHGAPMALREALLSHVEDTRMFSPDLCPPDLDPVGWTVPVGTAVRAQSGCPTMHGLIQQCRRLVDAGLLAPSNDHHDHDRPDDDLPLVGLRRYRLVLAAPAWPVAPPADPSGLDPAPRGRTGSSGSREPR